MPLCNLKFLFIELGITRGHETIMSRFCGIYFIKNDFHITFKCVIFNKC